MNTMLIRLVFLLIVFSPVLTLLLETILKTDPNGVNWFSLAVSSGRVPALLIRSLFLAGFVAAGSMILGVLAASFIWPWSKKRKWFLVLVWIVITFILVPPYVHALAWSSLFYQINLALISLGFPSFPAQGVIISWWIQLMALLPIGLGLALAGFASNDPVLVENGRLLRNDITVFKKIILPQVFPAIMTGGVLVFLFTLMDYSVPSLFMVNTYSLEIFAEYSATNNPARAFLLAVPLLIITLMIVRCSQSIFSRTAAGFGRIGGKMPLPLEYPTWFRGLQLLAISIFCVQVIVPLGSLLMQAGSLDNFWTSITKSRREITYSLVLALAAAAACLPLAYSMAKRLMKQQTNKWWWIVTLFPLAIPAPLVGIGLISLWNRPFFPDFYGSFLMPLLAVLARFLPIAVLIILAQLRRVDPLLLDAAKVFQANSLHTLIKVKTPLLLPSFVAAASLIAVLVIGELGATLIVIPPGQSTLTIKVYNYMHYGASETVAGLCLALLLIALALGWLMVLLGGFLRNRER